MSAKPEKRKPKVRYMKKEDTKRSWDELRKKPGVVILETAERKP